MLVRGALLWATLATAVSCVRAATQGPAFRYLILDSTHDVPSISNILMALEASEAPGSNTVFLGAITTEVPGLKPLEELLEAQNFTRCFRFLSSNTYELNPVDGVSKDLSKAPATVQFLVNMVNTYPGQVTIYASGSLSAVAYADQIDPSFARNLQELIIVGSIDDTRNTYATTGRVTIRGDGPFIQDTDAFYRMHGSGVPSIRMMAPLHPIVAGHETAHAVLKALIAEFGEDNKSWRQTRPFAAIYYDVQMQRISQGQDRVVLFQEPGLAALLYPELITQEDDIQMGLEPDDDDPNKYYMEVRKLPDGSADPNMRLTLILGLHEDKFLEHQIRLHSMNWSGYCNDAVRDATESISETEHDEL